MTTTIAIDDTVHRRLVQLKEDRKAASMNEVVKSLLDDVARLPTSMFGVDPKLRPLTRRVRNEM